MQPKYFENLPNESCNRIVIAKVSTSKLFDLQNFFSKNDSIGSDSAYNHEKNQKRQSTAYRIQSNRSLNRRASEDKIVSPNLTSNKSIKINQNLVLKKFDNKEI